MIKELGDIQMLSRDIILHIYPHLKIQNILLIRLKPTPSNTAPDTVITPKNNAKPQQTDAHKIVRHSTRVISRPTGSFTDAFNKSKSQWCWNI